MLQIAPSSVVAGSAVVAAGVTGARSEPAPSVVGARSQPAPGTSTRSEPGYSGVRDRSKSAAHKVKCFVCGQFGHFARRCPKRHASESVVTGSNANAKENSSSVAHVNAVTLCSNEDTYRNGIKWWNGKEIDGAIQMPVNSPLLTVAVENGKKFWKWPFEV